MYITAESSTYKFYLQKLSFTKIKTTQGKRGVILICTHIIDSPAGPIHVKYISDHQVQVEYALF